MHYWTPVRFLMAYWWSALVDLRWQWTCPVGEILWKTFCLLFPPPEGPWGPISGGPERTLGGQGGEDPRDVTLRTPAQLGPALCHRQVWWWPTAGAHGLPGPETAAGQSGLARGLPGPEAAAGQSGLASGLPGPEAAAGQSGLACGLPGPETAAGQSGLSCLAHGLPGPETAAGQSGLILSLDYGLPGPEAAADQSGLVLLMWSALFWNSCRSVWSCLV